MSWSYPAGFSAATAVQHANFCQQAYFQYYTLAETPPEFGYPPFSQFMQLPPSGYKLLYNIWYDEGVFEWDPVYFGYVACSANDPTQIVIAIRGTENSEEWTADIMESFQVPSPIANSKGMVHDGFATIYNGQGGSNGKGLQYYAPPAGNLVPPQKSDPTVPLAKVLAGAKSVMVTGHSLGAALAVLLTMDIALNVGCPVASYNFASPMVGDPVFAVFYNQMLGQAITVNYRVANGMDPAPNLPPNVFYPPSSSVENDYQQVDGYCPIDSGILSIIGDPHSLSNYVIGLQNIGQTLPVTTPSQRSAAGLRMIPKRRTSLTQAGRAA